MTIADRAPTPSVDDRLDAPRGETYLTGMQALVRLPLDQRRLDLRNGLDTSVLVSGYEGSPLAGYDLQLLKQTKRMSENKVVVRPSVNEELAANAIQGSQLASASADRIGDGVVGVWYGKAPGLDRATDAIRHANLGGTDHRGGVLALIGDDSIAKSSTVPSSSEAAIAELGMPFYAPADAGDIIEYGLHGIAMSRFSGLWTGLKLATNVVDGAATVDLDLPAIEPVFPSREIDGVEFRHEASAMFLQPRLGELERTMFGARMELVRRYAAANPVDRILGDPEAKIGVVAAGASYLDMREALAILGVADENLDTSGIRVLKLGLVFPLDPAVIDEFAAGLDEIVVIEEKRAFIELAIKDLLYGRENAPRVLGRRDAAGAELFRQDGDLPADLIARRLAPQCAAAGVAAASAWLNRSRPSRIALPLLPASAMRTPFFCSGCPHNVSTRVPEGSLTGLGIGCHGLTSVLDEDRVGELVGFTQMGGEGASWVGMSPFVDRNHLFQNIGDGTYHHSGSLALRAAVASGVNMTYKLLYNDAVAMTGGQQAVGKMSVGEIAREVLAEGVARVVLTTDDPGRYGNAARRRMRPIGLPRGVQVRRREDLDEVQRELAAVPGVTVLIHEQECATELRRKRKRGLAPDPVQRIFINERVCEGCGDCGDVSNCMSVHPVETEFGRKTRIHQASCNKDFTCARGDCPSFISVIPGKAGAAVIPTTRDDLPEPRRRVCTSDYSIRITGMGGTGVVTVSQVLATAAALAGLQVRGLDQLGLAQKGGAVVSDIRMSETEIVGTNKLRDGACDLYLGCDFLVAADDKNLAAMSPERTHSVVSTTLVPTGQMVSHVDAETPDTSVLRRRIEAGSAGEIDVFVDARAAVLRAFGNDQYTNVFLLGVAMQAGALPLAPGDVETALERNGVQVERNLAAFRLGREHVAFGPRKGGGAVRTTHSRVAAIAAMVAAPRGSRLNELVTLRVAELIAYQDEKYARRYAVEIEAVRAAEAASLIGGTAISETYAENLFKVMAYKDEYEVARLSTDPELRRRIANEFGEGARYSFMLHPPILRAMGMQNKLKIPGQADVGLRAMYAARRLRGTRLDPFGRGEVRAAERDLIRDYRDTMRRAVRALNDDSADIVRGIAALPDVVRGYEHIKLRNLDEYRSRRDRLLAELNALATATV